MPEKEIPPHIMNVVRPNPTPMLQPTPDQDVKLNLLAQKLGITREEVLDKILESIPDEEPKESFTDQSLKKIEVARKLGLAKEDMTDPINVKAKLKILKDMDKEEQMSMKEMLQMGLLLRILPPQENQQGGGMAVQEMRGEFERQRQYYEEKLKEQDVKIREMVFEKKIQNMQEDIVGDRKNLANQLSSMEQKIEALKNVPPNPTPEQKKDAIDQLEEIGGQVERIKKALSPFGILSQAHPSLPGSDPYKNPDGTFDYFRFTVDKLDNTVGRVMNAWEKKTPGQKKVAETPAPEEPQPQYRYRQLSPEEYCNMLLNNPNRTPEEQQWLQNYQEHLSRQLAQLQPQPKVQPQIQQAPQESPTANEPPKCSLCGSLGIFKDGLCEKCWTSGTEKPEKKTSMIEKLKAQEEEELKRQRERQ